MKFFIAAAALYALAILPFAANAAAEEQPQAKLQIVCTTYPMMLFTREVVKGREGIQLTRLGSSATGCLHDYVLTPQDMVRIGSADILIANGLGMENFLGDALKKVNDKIKIVDTSAGIPSLITAKDDDDEHHEAKEEKPAEAKSEEPKGDEPKLSDKGLDLPDRNPLHKHEGGTNPHLFSSPRQAALIVKRIGDELGKFDPANAGLYRKNAEAATAAYNKLANEMAAEISKLPNKKIVAEHEILDYLARDCGMEIVAVVEATPGEAPAAARLLELVKTLKASGAGAIFTEPQYPAKAGETLAKEIGIPCAMLDPVATGPDNAPEGYYEKAMRANLAIIVKSLGGK